MRSPRPLCKKARPQSAFQRDYSAEGGTIWLSRSPAETDHLGQILGRCARGGEVLALFGNLGTGKTALVRGLATGLGASPSNVSSPTFTLIHEYHGRRSLAHADLYRIRSSTELPHLGLSEYLDGHRVVAIEWAEKAGAELPPDRLEICFEHLTTRTRLVRLKALGIQARRLLTLAEKQWSQLGPVIGSNMRTPHDD